MTEPQQRNLRRLEKLSGRLNEMLEDGTIHEIHPRKVRSLIRKVRRLYHRLMGVVPEATLRGILAAASVLVLSFSSCYESSSNEPEDGSCEGPVTPSFAGPVHNPFGINLGSYYFLCMDFADMDGDGDQDIIGMNYGYEYYYYAGGIVYMENVGTASNASFADPVENPFGISDKAFISCPELADIDGDGDLDLLGYGYANDSYYGYYYYGSILYLENTGTARNPSFAEPVENPFGIAEDEYLIAPILADIDGDGDLDMLAGSYFYGYDDYYYTIQYYENTGTAGSPSFAAPLQDPFGLTGVEDIVVPELADIDLDGDLDLFLGSYYGITIYHENIGTRTDPHFSGGVAHPFGIPAFNYIPVPRLADIDDDGDMDLFIEDYYEGVIFFENTSC